MQYPQQKDELYVAVNMSYGSGQQSQVACLAGAWPREYKTEGGIRKRLYPWEQGEHRIPTEDLFSAHTSVGEIQPASQNAAAELLHWCSPWPPNKSSNNLFGGWEESKMFAFRTNTDSAQRKPLQSLHLPFVTRISLTLWMGERGGEQSITYPLFN